MTKIEIKRASNFQLFMIALNNGFIRLLTQEELDNYNRLTKANLSFGYKYIPYHSDNPLICHEWTLISEYIQYDILHPQYIRNEINNKPLIY